MKTETLKKIKDIEKLCEVENFILANGRDITKQDKEILRIAESVMQDYTYGWYIYDENIIEQLKSINKFKVWILDLIGKWVGEWIVWNSSWQKNKIII